MEKSKLMEELEDRAGEFGALHSRGDMQGTPTVGYVKLLEAELTSARTKAAAYDRLMSGGKKTLKEWANILHRIVVLRKDGFGQSFKHIPDLDEKWGGIWWFPNEEHYEDEEYFIPPDLIDFKGDWTTSLTLPDGWEEA